MPNTENCDNPFCDCEIPNIQTMTDLKFHAGEIVFDKKRTEVTSDMLVIHDPDVGNVGSLSGETGRLVRNNDANKEIGFSDSTTAVEAIYITEEDDGTVGLGDRIYTFPVSRLARVESPKDHSLDELRPHEWAIATFLSELMSALNEQDYTVERAEDLQVLCMDASIDGRVITRASGEKIHKVRQ